MKKSSTLPISFFTSLICVFFMVEVSLGQTEMNPTNHAYISYYKEEVLKGIQEKGLKEYLFHLQKNAELTEENILTKESYFKQLTFLAIGLEVGEDVLDGQKHLLKDAYPIYEQKIKDKLANQNKYDFYFADDSEIDKQKRLFVYFDKYPTFEECKDLTSNNNRRKCLVIGVSNHIKENLPYSDILRIARKEKLMKKMEKGKRLYRVKVKIEISQDGSVTWAEGDSSQAKINEIIEKTILSLPKLQPAILNEQAVSVIYTLPIVVQENQYR